MTKCESPIYLLLILLMNNFRNTTGRASRRPELNGFVHDRSRPETAKHTYLPRGNATVTEPISGSSPHLINDIAPTAKPIFNAAQSLPTKRHSPNLLENFVVDMSLPGAAEHIKKQLAVKSRKTFRLRTWFFR